MKQVRFLLLCVVVGFFYSCSSERPNSLTESDDTNPHYLDPYRPQIHYSRDSGWLSDPNGLFYLNGAWHLMFQGFSRNVPGGTSWDHASTEDLLHWKNLPRVLNGKSNISYYSGCSVVDNNNVSGLAKDGKVPVLAFYTTHPEGLISGKPSPNKISLAYSLDSGKNWTYGNTDVISNKEFSDERDPSVFWHAQSKKWIMATAGTGFIRFYSSVNLLEWKFESKSLPYPSWECPSLANIKVEETGEEKVLLITSTNGGVPNSSHGTCYHVGTFDGQNFIPEDTTTTKHWIDWGSDFYAGINYSNAPENRTLFQSWFGWPCQWGNSPRTTKFLGSMNLIRELKLHVDDKGSYYLKSNPIDEYKKLRRDSTIIRDLEISGRKDIRKHIGSHEPLEIILEADVSEGTVFGIRLKNDFGEDYLFQYDDWNKRFNGDRTNAGTLPGHYTNSYNSISIMPYEAKNNKLKLRIYWDVSTFEVFVDEGKEGFSQLFFPREPFSVLELYAFGGLAKVKTLKIYDLKSIWKK